MDSRVVEDARRRRKPDVGYRRPPECDLGVVATEDEVIDYGIRYNIIKPSLTRVRPLIQDAGVHSACLLPFISRPHNHASAHDPHPPTHAHPPSHNHSIFALLHQHSYRRQQKHGQDLQVVKRRDADNFQVVHAGTAKYTAICGLAGILCAGGTHLASTPLDVLKCRMQADPKKYPNISTAWKVTLAENGARGLVRGWAPTFFGYGLQGFSKFGFYDLFKVQYSHLLGPEFSKRHDVLIWFTASATAEAVGDIALAPFEAVKVRVQTTATALPSMFHTFTAIKRSEGIGGFFKGLSPLMLRQIPYTTSKFVCFDFVSQKIYRDVLKRPRKACTRKEQQKVSMISGIIAGVVCAVFSHPPDVVVSRLYKDPNARLWATTRALGWRGLWTGLGPRIVMMGSIAAMQLFIFDNVRMTFHLEQPDKH